MKTKQIQIKYIEKDDAIVAIRKIPSEEAIGRYMEKYNSGTTKPIKVKEIDRKKYILIDGHHRLEAVKRLKKEKIDAELFEGDDVYSAAVEANQEHGVPLTKDEEKSVFVNLIKVGKTQKEIGVIFHISQGAVSQRISNDKELQLLVANKSGVSTINEILSGKTQKEISGIYDIAQQTVSQRWNNWLDEITEQYETGTTKQELIEQENEKGIKLTLEKLNELIEEDYNKLIIGDCLEEIPKLDDNSINCLIIDPPYGINYQSNYRKENFDKIKDDDESAFKLLDDTLRLVEPKIKNNSHIYVFTSWKVYDKVKPIVERYFDLKNCLVWNKNNWSMGDLAGNYAEKHELILFASKGKRKIQSEIRPTNVLDYARTNNPEHPTQKPVDLLKELVRNSTKEKELVLDCFAGSGSTLLACKEEKRKWLGIEIEEKE